MFMFLFYFYSFALLDVVEPNHVFFATFKLLLLNIFATFVIFFPSKFSVIIIIEHLNILSSNQI